MKISIIAFNDIKLCPYINPYANFCRENCIEFEVVFANRSCTEQTADYTTVPISWDRSKRKWQNFLSFRRDVKKHLKANKRDFVIVLTTMPAVLLGGYLRKNYRNKYIVDIRDYTYEDVKPFFCLEKRAISTAAMSVISSPGFVNFLPKADYTLCHNTNATYRQDAGYRFSPKNSDPIIIGYAGSISYKSNCRKLIDLVKDDARFAFHLYGGESGANEITDYIASLDCDRIKAFGPYKPEEKVDIIKSVDILFNVYGNNSKLVKYALSNKLYDSFYMKRPLLTSPNTSMSDEASVFSFDLGFDKSGELDALYDWYHSIDANAFEEYSNSYLKGVFADQDQFLKKLKNAIIG